MKRKSSVIAVVVLSVLCACIAASLLLVKEITGEKRMSKWGDYGFYYENQSHFGDIRRNDEFRNFGGRDWNSLELTSEDFDRSVKHGGKLVRKYFYYDNDASSRNYGEQVYLYVYDLSEIISPNGIMCSDSIDREKYIALANEYCPNDSSYFHKTQKFKPNVAVESSVGLDMILSDDHESIKETYFAKNVIVFANERAYHFNFYNHNPDLKGKEVFEKLDRRFSKIVSKIDFETYRNWKGEYVNNLLAKDKSKGYYVWLCSIIVLLLAKSVSISFIRPKKNNNSARKTSIYLTSIVSVSILCAALFLYVDVFNRSIDEEVLSGLFLLAILIITIYDILIISARTCSHQEYDKFYLIPPFVKNTICRGSDVKSRLLLLLYFLPLYYIAPIPFVGWFFFLFYILPMTAIIAIWYGVAWVLGDKKVSLAAPSLGFQKKQKRFCRHCGKPIDPSARFCRHCGKEV